MSTLSRDRGFTIIELLVVVVLILILGSLVAVTASGVRAKNRNTERQHAIVTIQGQLEAHYALTGKYPTLANINDATWRAANVKKIRTIQDPRWSKTIADCTTQDKAVLSAKPAANCYSYQVTSADGAACDNVTIDCIHYTLTASLEGGEKYVKSSLN